MHSGTVLASLLRGVPYLGLAVSLVSFSMLLTSFVCATFVYGQFLVIAMSLNWCFSKIKVNYSYELMGGIVGILSSILSSLLTVMSYQGISSIIFTGGVVLQENWQILLVTVGLSFVIIYLSFNPQRVKWFAIFLTFFLVSSISISLFIQPVYTFFLSTIKYGGGVELKITMTDQKGKVDEIEGALFLTTSDRYILYIDTDSNFLEIPKSKVIKLSY